MSDRPSWEVRVTVELFRNDRSVASRRARTGAFEEHIPYDRLTAVRAATSIARGAAMDVVKRAANG